jgi:hypothetical protein
MFINSVLFSLNNVLNSKTLPGLKLAQRLGAAHGRHYSYYSGPLFNK